ncbi:DUF3418 domain-containing protein [Streptomyces sp. P38-E01]|uniref:DUF3418 domain-containing protein n=1 Tax=Streptomyces tardus TaxID=2780544 RepID=A0A949N3V6_9ACTN|nr:DUF3418 domain-containing protein [Streptomyces tardus]MBU7600455.1 DUF3418 domain-containing protein [Streptomyces tardus]
MEQLGVLATLGAVAQVREVLAAWQSCERRMKSPPLVSSTPHGSVQALFADCVSASVDRLVAVHGGPAWDEAAFRKLFDAVRAEQGLRAVPPVLPGPPGCRHADTSW